jgi:ribonuclease J
MLIRRGCQVKTRLTDRGVHVSGHAHRPEQRRMIELVRPRAFVPVHGTIHHLTRHAELAREAGVEEVAVIENGRVLELSGGKLTLGRALPAGRVHVWNGREVPASVIRERTVLAEDGAAFCTVVVDAAGTAVDVQLSTRGVLDETANARELDEVRAAVRRAIAEVELPATDETMAEHARWAVRRTFQKTRGRKPITIVHLRRIPP